MWNLSILSLSECVATVASIMRKWKICVNQVVEASTRFSSLSDSLPEGTVAEWSSTEGMMQELRSIDVEVMDDYDVREDRG